MEAEHYKKYIHVIFWVLDRGIFKQNAGCGSFESALVISAWQTKQSKFPAVDTSRTE
jgi:hypothetical protein